MNAAFSLSIFMNQQAALFRHAELTLVVVGGGPAGVYGAIWAKTTCPHLRVLVLERGQFLTKVKISGGSRCNVTTGLFVDPLDLAQQYPRGHKELKGTYFRTHGPSETTAWFEEHGVQLKTEEDGRMFPVTDDSGTIVNCLLNEARRVGVSLKSRTSVKEVVSSNGRFDIHYKCSGESSLSQMQADFALLATGSATQGYNLAMGLGHTLVQPIPSLFTFKVMDPVLKELAGVSFDIVCLEMEIEGYKKRNAHFRQKGALLITHWGLSGPAILRISAWAARELFAANYRGTLFVDFAPDSTIQEVKKLLTKQKLLSPRRKLHTGAPHTLGLVRRFWQYMINKLDMHNEITWCELSNKTLHDLASVLKSCSFRISGKAEFKDEFVTAGGIPLDEVNLKTMESKKCPNLYLAGELLNIDGITGGFNFQNAWTSGYISGLAIAGQIQYRKANI